MCSLILSRRDPQFDDLCCFPKIDRRPLLYVQPVKPHAGGSLPRLGTTIHITRRLIRLLPYVSHQRVLRRKTLSL
jgi:hypothetical protein